VGTGQPPVAPTSFLELGTRRLEWQEIPGDAARPPLVFLHEGLGSVGLWRGFPALVASAVRARAVVFSRYGHGWSDPPPAPRTPRFMHDEALEVLPAVLSRTGARDPVLVGHSDGASIALIHAAVHPVRGVVALAPHVFVEDVTLTGIRAAREAFRRGDLRRRMAGHHADPDTTFCGWCDVWLDPAFRGWSLLDEVSRIAAPLLLIQGAADEYGTLAQLDAIRERARGHVELLVLDAGHSPHLDRPQEVIDGIAAFVGRLADGESAGARRDRRGRVGGIRNADDLAGQ
jgi:pimeloyl-ACP methyl ester carboxylesterase